MICFNAILVAPLAGAWIEIVVSKSARSPILVAPLAGAWIEIKYQRCGTGRDISRSPCGSVD